MWLPREHAIADRDRVAGFRLDGGFALEKVVMDLVSARLAVDGNGREDEPISDEAVGFGLEGALRAHGNRERAEREECEERTAHYRAAGDAVGAGAGAGAAPRPAPPGAPGPPGPPRPPRPAFW